MPVQPFLIFPYDQVKCIIPGIFITELQDQVFVTLAGQSNGFEASSLLYILTPDIQFGLRLRY